ncbi:Alpha/Beta hydrolase protein [Chaetomium strumarium]|uniref:Alpha/Beta hydrolase protein n=1 Tax=Chaetomium strumarium TaxID=1170767 RepID=A0AAJ0GKS7_9PEZI|nr:Alpha/Beta hydrolase protein [Chaetomium strumarium]
MAIFHSKVDSASLFFRHYIPSSSPYKPASTVAHQPLTLVFLHGWPMSSRMYDQLIVPLVETHRFPVIAPDRRGFGNSEWTTPTTTAEGVTFDTFVADLISLLEHALLGNTNTNTNTNPSYSAPFVFVAASMGCSESVLARAASSFVRAHCKGFVWIGPNMPYSLRCDECPAAPDRAVWEGLIDGFRGAGGKDFIAQALPGVFRVDLGNEVGKRTLQFFERIVGQADPMALERTTTILQRPMVAELKRLADEEGGANKPDRIPVLILHGDSDSGMPLEASAAVVHEMLPWSELKVYEKAGHGLYLTHAQQVLDDLLAFLSPIVARLQ